MTFLVIDGKKYQLSISNLSLKTLKWKDVSAGLETLPLPFALILGKLRFKALSFNAKINLTKASCWDKFFEALQGVIKEFWTQIFSAEPGNKSLNNPTLTFSYIELCKCLLSSLLFHIIPFPMKSLRSEVPCERYHIFIYLP